MNDDSGYENLNKISWIPQKFMEYLEFMENFLEVGKVVIVTKNFTFIS